MTTTTAPDARPRIAPGTRRDIGIVNDLTVRVLGAATGTHRPGLFATLARHRRVYRRWLRFAASLMPGGELPREDGELLILRTAHNCGCAYEIEHHERLAVEAGLDLTQVARVGDGAEADGWTPRQRLLLDAVDELQRDHTLSQETWDGLRRHLDDTQLIELPLLVGHYQMLALALNSLHVRPDRPAAPRGVLGRVATAVAARRRPGARAVDRHHPRSTP